MDKKSDDEIENVFKSEPIEFEQSKESEDDYEPHMENPFDPTQINIISKPDTLHNIIERLKNDEIDMNTEFQRHADLWDNQKMSRLIESILIRFPLPAFYFDASNDEKWLVVDGLQRLSSIRKFIVKDESGENRPLRLNGLEYLREFDGKTYEDLPRTYKRRIDECPVTLFLIQPGTPEKVKYSIFRRINTGGLVLTDQEIRNAMANSSIRIYLEKLAGNDYLKKTVGDQRKRMIDQELVLRFLSFYTMDYEKETINITNFLDSMIDVLQESSKQNLAQYEDLFALAMKRCWDIFGEAAFEKRTIITENRRRRKNSTLFEVWSVALAKLSENEMELLKMRKELVQQKHLDAITTDDAYFRAITFSTQKRDHFRIRRDKVKNIIQEVLDA
ncbi:hypothetical protein SDC9_04325 [bioreactor metagenome]|uniref:GmrSD restriction endonucleases N-terminal domain-containing protein n=1 Tax=bioreactor metagenome TaxID=1076179 RepID=A0A644SVZ1_9ZZZZ